MENASIRRLLADTEVLRVPRRPLATFGATRISYHLISPLGAAARRTRLREGAVVSARPRILTPDALRERFQGFGEGPAEFGRWLSASYADLLRALEYGFRNQDLSARVLAEDARQVSDRLLADLDARGASDRAVVRCPDAGWALALMKLTLDEAARSFPGHVRDLERRGMFAPDRGEGDRRRRQVEALFADAARNPEKRAHLGARLREYGLFEEYEDRFLALF
ncbi:MAG: hypothetical protein HY552_04380 [Elusimicrobia bacterium]|nr:hypothetical protein [Elusimicrobiota bacterium]